MTVLKPQKIANERSSLLKALDRYWPNGSEAVAALPIVAWEMQRSESLPPACESIALPEWAEEMSVDGGLLIPRWAFLLAEGEWAKVDWFAVCFWYLHNLAERAYEDANGPIHSYAFRLKGWDSRLWARAWVNRIALFLRRWAVRESGKDEDELLGPLPETEIVLTHDVDAIEKTLAIRLKQTAFHGFNAIRFLCCFRLGQSFQRAFRAFHFLLSRENYWCFDQILELERSHGVKSRFHFYAGKMARGTRLKKWLMDPAYDVHEKRLSEQIVDLRKKKCEVGLHQSFDAWSDRDYMREEKSNLEQALGEEVTTCRQHWLRFSFRDTWKTQQEVGFQQDATLGFNDRSAFRNGAALAFNPIHVGYENQLDFVAFPMVLMDSHLYDYHSFQAEERNRELSRWLDEIKAVRGQATIIWHQRVMSEDYGWAEGYEQLLSKLT